MNLLRRSLPNTSTVAADLALTPVPAFLSGGLQVLALPATLGPKECAVHSFAGHLALDQDSLRGVDCSNARV